MSRASDWEAMARTVFGEARSTPNICQVGVAWVIKNRSLHPSWWGNTIEQVCFKPFQFSCWNEGDPNKPIAETATPEDAAYLAALGVAATVMTGNIADPVNGATHYYDQSIAAPGWTATMLKTADLGPFSFYREP